MSKQWRDIPGFEGYYKISSDGEVESLERTVASRGKNKRVDSKILEGCKTKKGYLTVNLHKNGTKSTFFIHRLVLLSFVGPAPEGTQCLHSDGNKINNKLANLRWGTAKENGQDKKNHNLTKKGKQSMIMHTAEPGLPVYFVADGGRVLCGTLVRHATSNSDFIPIDYEGRTLAIQRAEAWATELPALQYAEDLAHRRLRHWNAILIETELRLAELRKKES